MRMIHSVVIREKPPSKRPRLRSSTYYTHFKHKVPHEIYAWIRAGISRHISAIFVSAVLYFTLCGMVRCGAYI